MSFYTNDIKKRTEYQKDSALRNFSEKRLDRKFESQLSEIEKFESEFKSSATSIKKVKTQEKTETVNQIKEIPKHSQVIEKLLTHCLNPAKKTKSLSMLLKLIFSLEPGQIQPYQIINYSRKLIFLSIDVGNQSVNRCKMITQIFDKFSKMENYSKHEKQMVDLFKQFWQILRVLSEDDSFGFNAMITHLYKIIKEFEPNKLEIDNYLGAMEIKIKVEQSQLLQQKQPQKEDEDLNKVRKDHEKRNLILLAIKRLLELDISWKKLSIDQFMKNFSNEHKTRILHPKQIQQFQELHKQYLNRRTKNSLDKEKQLIRDQIINKNNVAQINAEVKEINAESSNIYGNDKWVSKQQ